MIDKKELSQIKEQILHEMQYSESAGYCLYELPLHLPEYEEYAEMRLWHVLFNTGYFEERYHEVVPPGIVKFSDKYQGRDYIKVSKELMEKIRTTDAYKQGYRQSLKNTE